MNNAAFASMRVRMAERRLLTEEQLQRMIQASSLEGALQVLRESRYSSIVNQADQPEKMEQGLRQILEEEVQDLASMVRDTDLRHFLFMRYDYHNLKVLIKAATDPERYEGLLFPFGTYFIPEMKRMIAHPQAIAGDVMNQAIVEGSRAWNRTHDAQELDFIVDRVSFLHLKEVANKLKRPFFEGYLRDLADFTNVLSYFRALRRGEGPGFVDRVFVHGGALKRSDLLKASLYPAAGKRGSLQKEGLEVLSNLMRAKTVPDALQQAVRAYFDSGRLADFERARDAFLFERSVEAGRKTTEGPEVLFAYLQRIEAEITNIRLILSAKRVGLSAEALMDRVRLPKMKKEKEKSRA